MNPHLYYDLQPNHRFDLHPRTLHSLFSLLRHTANSTCAHINTQAEGRSACVSIWLATEQMKTRVSAPRPGARRSAGLFSFSGGLAHFTANCLDWLCTCSGEEFSITFALQTRGATPAASFRWFDTGSLYKKCNPPSLFNQAILTNIQRDLEGGIMKQKRSILHNNYIKGRTVCWKAKTRSFILLLSLCGHKSIWC